MTTKAQHSQMVKDLDRIDGVHECAEYVVRAVGGDHINGGGVSMWCCDACLPMRLEVIGRAYPDAREEGRKS